MAFSPDVLVTALQELLPGASETFTKWHPLMANVLERKQKRTAQGPFIEFVLTPDGPGSLTTVLTGQETISGGRKQNSVRANTFAATMIYAWDVPGQDLREANGDMDLAGLIKDYPMRGLAEFHEIISRQLAMGDGPGAGAFPTLNGDATYNPKGLGARQGVLSFQAPELQTDVVFGVAKNSIVGWHNQHRHITSFATNGRYQARGLYYDCSQEVAKTEGEIDLIFADRGTHDNMIEDLDDQVQILDKSVADKGDRGNSSFRRGVPFLNARLYSEVDIDPSGFTSTNANLGAAYFLHSAPWFCYNMGHGKMETKGDFALRGPIRHPTMDAWRYEYVLSAGMACKNLRCQGTLTGGAVR